MNAFIRNCLFPGSVLLLCLPDLFVDEAAPTFESSSHSTESYSHRGNVCRGASLLQTSSFAGGRRKANLGTSMALNEQAQNAHWYSVLFGVVALVLVLIMFASIMQVFYHDVTEHSKHIKPSALAEQSAYYQRQGAETQSQNIDTYNSPGASLDLGPAHPDIGNDREESDAGDYDLSEYITGVNHKHIERSVYDAGGVRKTIENNFGSWKLLQQILGALAQFWAALIFMYWSLLHNPHDLMNCNAHPNDHVYSVMVRHLCNYTYACLRGFPILAANMVLVLMIRILVQNRIYYSFLEVKLVVDFADTPILHTYWPWLTGLSMVNGGMHFVLKMWHDPADVVVSTYVTIARKFVLPGFIFFSFLLRYADIENTLIPLNRIVEQDYTKGDRHCPWFTTVEVVNERVLAFDVRHRDVVGDAQASCMGRPPTIKDIIANLTDNYERAHHSWQKRKHRRWGLFRSMWPAAVLVDGRLDKNDKDTRAWLIVFALSLVGSFLTSLFSLFSLFRSGSDAVASGWIFKGNSDAIAVDTEALLVDIVLVWHAVFIVVFLYHTICNMFHRAIVETETSVQDGARETVSRISRPRRTLIGNVYI